MQTTFTPLFGYDSKTFPFVLVRSTNLWILDTITFELKINKFQEHIARYGLEPSFVHNIVSTSDDTITTFGRDDENSILRFKMKDSVLQALKEKHQSNGEK